MGESIIKYSKIRPALDKIGSEIGKLYPNMSTPDYWKYMEEQCGIKFQTDYRPFLTVVDESKYTLFLLKYMS